jgi:hypothetical protein
VLMIAENMGAITDYANLGAALDEA